MSEKTDRLIRVAGVIEKMELQTTATLMREIAQEHAVLLEALEEIIADMDSDFGTGYDYDKARAAIARATGETQ